MEGDDILAIKIESSVREWKVRKGDLMILYRGDDVRDEDIAVIEVKGDDTWRIGQVHLRDACYFYLEESRYQFGVDRIQGRIVEVQRAGQVITPALSLRPIREQAKVYQFRRRA